MHVKYNLLWKHKLLRVAALYKSFLVPHSHTMCIGVLTRRYRRAISTLHVGVISSLTFLSLSLSLFILSFLLLTIMFNFIQFSWICFFAVFARARFLLNIIILCEYVLRIFVCLLPIFVAVVVVDVYIYFSPKNFPFLLLLLLFFVHRISTFTSYACCCTQNT